MPGWYFVLVVAITGLFFGSFFNVCIYRIPRRKSIVTPGSFCPRCRTPIRFYDNIPVLSFLLLRARCRKCGQPISWRYPLVELLTGLIFAAVAARFGPGWDCLRGLLLSGFLVVISFVDLDRQTIPDIVSLPGIAAGVLSALLVPGEPVPTLHGLVPALLGGAAGALSVLVIGWVWLKLTRREGLGGGDIRLAALLGVFLGWQKLLLVLFLLAPVLGVLVGGGLALFRRQKVFGRHIPFGPFLALAGLVALFFGDAILGWWLSGRLPVR